MGEEKAEEKVEVEREAAEMVEAATAVEMGEAVKVESQHCTNINHCFDASYQMLRICNHWNLFSFGNRLSMQ